MSRWTKEEEAELVAVARRFVSFGSGGGGDGKSLADWELVKGHLQTHAKWRSATALRDRYRFLTKSASKQEDRKEIKGEELPGANVEGVSAARGGSDPSLAQFVSPASSQDRNVQFPFVSPVTLHRRDSLEPLASNDNLAPPLWTVGEDAALLSTLIVPSPFVKTWADVHALAFRTYKLVEGQQFDKTVHECKHRYEYALKPVRFNGVDLARENVLSLEQHEFYSSRLSGHAVENPFLPLATSTPRPRDREQPASPSLNSRFFDPPDPASLARDALSNFIAQQIGFAFASDRSPLRSTEFESHRRPSLSSSPSIGIFQDSLPRHRVPDFPLSTREPQPTPIRPFTFDSDEHRPSSQASSSFSPPFPFVNDAHASRSAFSTPSTVSEYPRLSVPPETADHQSGKVGLGIDFGGGGGPTRPMNEDAEAVMTQNEVMTGSDEARDSSTTSPPLKRRKVQLIEQVER
ncbi:hypothetical protein JCM3766R1_002698 [Sporobolomyces carnicolor]